MQEQQLAPMSAGLTMVVDFEAIKFRISQLQEFVKGYMKKGDDYGIVPGTDKLTLLKPGAEKLCDVYGLAAGEAKIEFTRDDTKSPIYISYRVSLPLISRADGRVIMVGVGSANSWEKKYKWRWVSEKKVPPTLDKNSLLFEERNGQYGSYRSYRIPNEEIDDIDNTLLKMAKKRALVDAVLSATRSSALFTQDMEDGMDPNGADDRHTPSKNPDKSRGNEHHPQQNASSNNNNQSQPGTNAPKNEKPEQNSGSSHGASDNQVRAIKNIASHKGLSEEDLAWVVKDLTGKDSIADLSSREASNVIGALQKQNDKKAV